MADARIPAPPARRRVSLPAMKLSSTQLANLTAKYARATLNDSALPKLNESPELGQSSPRPGQRSNAKSNPPKPDTRKSQDDGMTDPVTENGPRYVRSRRHSVDILMMPNNNNMQVGSLAPKSQEDDPRSVWAEICRVSDPHNFDREEYEKERLPHGSSAFQSVLDELDEESDSELSVKDSSGSKQDKDIQDKPEGIQKNVRF